MADAPSSIAAPKYLGPAAGLAQSVFSAPGPQFGNVALIEVGRGCSHACRFCAAGHLYRPPRLGRGADFLEAAGQAARQWGRVGLVSAAVSDIEGLDKLADRVLRERGKLSVSSLRADRLGPGLVAALAQSHHQTVALAPEAGSLRLRRVINKHLSEDELLKAAELLIQGGGAQPQSLFHGGVAQRARPGCD
ncbi:hypothetical protein DFAR_1010001 [Desulfarculales bacterium]